MEMTGLLCNMQKQGMLFQQEMTVVSIDSRQFFLQVSFCKER